MKTLFALLLSSLSLFPQSTAVFPAAVATDSQTYIASDNAQTTLSAPLNNSSLSVPVASTANFTTPTLITIDNEQLSVCSRTSTSFTVCSGGRGAAGTGATTHLSNAKVKLLVAAAFHNNTAAELQAVETKLHAEFPTSKDKGCKGDNTHDDTSCFQAAINDSLARGLPLHCTGGTYKITGPLVATLLGTDFYTNSSNWSLLGDGTCILEDWATNGAGLLEVKSGIAFSYDGVVISGIVFRRHQGAAGAGNPAFAVKLDALVGTKFNDNKILCDPYHPEQAFTYGLWINGTQQGEVAGNVIEAAGIGVYHTISSGTGFDGQSGQMDFHGNTIDHGNECYRLTGPDAWISADHLTNCPVGIHNIGGSVHANMVHFEAHTTASYLQDGGGGRATILNSAFFNPPPRIEISIQTGDANIISNPVLNGSVIFAAGTCTTGTPSETGCTFAFNHYGTAPADASGRVMYMGNIWAGAATAITLPTQFGQPIQMNSPYAAGIIPTMLVLQANPGFGQDMFAKVNATGSNVSGWMLNGQTGVCNDTSASFVSLGTGMAVASGSCGTSWLKAKSDRVEVPRIVSYGAAPTCGGTAGGGGAGFVCTVAGTDTLGIITVTIGAGPAGTQIATLTAPITFPTMYHMTLSPANSAAGALAANAAYVAGNTTNSVNLYTPTSALTAGTTYMWNYSAGGR